MIKKVVWKSVTVRLGVQSVMISGAVLMLVWPVFNWDINALVITVITLCRIDRDTLHQIHDWFNSTIGATAFSNAFFGQGTGRILLDNLGCVGTETRLVDCPHNGIGIENCVHAEDAGLRCTGI